MQAFLVFLDVEGPILIEVAAEVYGPQLDDGLGHRFGPAHARSFHAVLDEVFAGALHRTTGDGQATCQILVIVHATPVAVEIVRHARQHLALAATERKMLSSVANYLYRNRSRMHYDQYLARGLPIASGSVEGACKNLIKDRMERSGMRWTEAMAEAIVKLRAIYLSGDFDQYWPFHIQKDQERLHPAGRWSVVEK